MKLNILTNATVAGVGVRGRGGETVLGGRERERREEEKVKANERQ